MFLVFLIDADVQPNPYCIAFKAHPNTAASSAAAHTASYLESAYLPNVHICAILSDDRIKEL